METSVSAPLARTSGTMYSSLRTLLPPKASGLLTSSRFAHTWAPPPFAARWSLSRLRWWTGEGPNVSGWRSNWSRITGGLLRVGVARGREGVGHNILDIAAWLRV